MKEKELRLALVFHGGVSLAIYQHGVNVEILNLIRAFRAVLSVGCELVSNGHAQMVDKRRKALRRRIFWMPQARSNKG